MRINKIVSRFIPQISIHPCDQNTLLTSNLQTFDITIETKLSEQKDNVWNFITISLNMCRIRHRNETVWVGSISYYWAPYVDRLISKGCHWQRTCFDMIMESTWRCTQGALTHLSHYERCHLNLLSLNYSTSVWTKSVTECHSKATLIKNIIV